MESIEDPFIHTVQSQITFKDATDLRKMSEEASANLANSIAPHHPSPRRQRPIETDPAEQTCSKAFTQCCYENTQNEENGQLSLMYQQAQMGISAHDTFALGKGKFNIVEAKQEEKFQSNQSQVTPTQNFEDNKKGGYLSSPLRFIVAEPDKTIEKSFESNMSSHELKEKRQNTESVEDTQEASLDSIREQGMKQIQMSREGAPIIMRKASNEEHPLSPSIGESGDKKKTLSPLKRPKLLKKLSLSSGKTDRRGSLSIDQYVRLSENVSKKRVPKTYYLNVSGSGVSSGSNTPTLRLTRKAESTRNPSRGTGGGGILQNKRVHSLTDSPRQLDDSSHYEMNSLRVMDQYYKDDDNDVPLASQSPPQGRGEQEISRKINPSPLQDHQSEEDESVGSPIHRLNLQKVIEVQEDDTNTGPYITVKSKGHIRSISNGQMVSQKSGGLLQDEKEMTLLTFEGSQSPLKDRYRISLFGQQQLGSLSGRKSGPSIFQLKNLGKGHAASNSSLFMDQTDWHFGSAPNSRLNSERLSSQLSVQNRLEMIEMKRENMKHIEQAILLFNSGKPKIAFKYLQEQGTISSDEYGNQVQERRGSHESVTAALTSQKHMDIAKFLYHIRGLDKQRIGDLLGKNSQDSSKLRHCYASLFSFQNEEFDEAMRQFLGKIRLPKESQQIERILEAFSTRYFEENKEKFPSEVETFTLAYSLLLLNVDLHSQAIAKHRKMTKHQFVRNNHDCCATLPENYLEYIYDRICEKPLETKIDDIEKAYRRLGLVYHEKEMLADDEMKEDLRRSSLGSEFVRGSYFTKYGRYGNPHKKLVRLTADGKKVQWFSIDENGHPTGHEKHISVKDIEQVLVGSTHTKVFRKQNIPKEMDNCCISIITDKRSLDLRHDNPEVIKKWYNEMISSLKEISKGQEDEAMAAKIANYSSLEVKQAIFQIWGNEILQNWNKYWNSTTGQPLPVNIVLNLSSIQLRRITKVGEAAAMAHGNPHITRKIKSSIARQLSTTFEALWLQGIPDPMRKVIWPIVIENKLKITERFHQILQLRAEHRESLNAPMGFSEAASSTPSQKRMQTEIVKSVAGVKHSDPQYLQTQLDNLLRTFLEYRPDLEYIKGMADIGLAFLISCSTEYSAFVCFTNLLHSSHFMHYFTSDMAEINWRLQYFEELFQLQLPQLSTHFKTLEFTTDMYLLDWYVTLFFRILPQHAVLRVWDGFFLRGEIYIIQVALALLKYLEPKIKFKSVKHIMQVFGTMRKEESVFNEQLFFSLVVDTKVSRQQFEGHLTQQREAEHKSQVFRYFIE